ncbi:MAG: hypothetical protein PHZ25_01050 [Candidatus Pacebacteria bacterium]|nr:hypothetical protein [Candidatus Paceibacterota bacterium]
MALNFKKILSGKNTERFFCLEIGDSFLRGSFLEVSENKINVIFSSNRLLKNSDLSDDGFKKRISIELVKDFLKKINIPLGCKIIVIGASSFVFTVPAWVRVDRENSKEEINEGEIENLISQAVWKFLNLFRPQAVNLLNINESDILLSGIRNLSVKVNGHKVLNPIGFKAKTVEFLIEETFVNRDYYRDLEDALGRKFKIEFISELGLVDSEIIFRSFNFENSFSLLRFFPESVLILKSFYKNVSQEDISPPVLREESFLEWNSSFLPSCLGKKLNLDNETSLKIIDLVSKKNSSAKIEKFVKDSLIEEWDIFFKKISSKGKLEKENKIFVLDEKNIPDFIFNKKNKPKLEKPDVLKIIEKLGFSVFFKVSELEIESVFSSLAGFLEYYFSSREDQLNKMARRRAKWLIP